MKKDATRYVTTIWPIGVGVLNSGYGYESAEPFKNALQIVVY